MSTLTTFLDGSTLNYPLIIVNFNLVFITFIMKMEISILYHVIVNGQLNRDNLIRDYINAFDKS